MHRPRGGRGPASDMLSAVLGVVPACRHRRAAVGALPALKAALLRLVNKKRGVLSAAPLSFGMCF